MLILKVEFVNGMETRVWSTYEEFDLMVADVSYRHKTLGYIEELFGYEVKKIYIA